MFLTEKKEEEYVTTEGILVVSLFAPIAWILVKVSITLYIHFIHHHVMHHIVRLYSFSFLSKAGAKPNILLHLHYMWMNHSPSGDVPDYYSITFIEGCSRTGTIVEERCLYGTYVAVMFNGHNGRMVKIATVIFMLFLISHSHTHTQAIRRC